ncbi:hypothetical protein [Streptomyces murinus]|uniref:hypothetical protein n=1 Tax=Streptomyces murinus TaxID=33900 RepID=UPI003F45A5F8
MFFQLLDGAPVKAIIPVGTVCAVLALARVVKNLPKDSITKYFEHRTTKYKIIANDANGRVAFVQKQWLVFLGFLVACAVVVGLALIGSASGRPQAPSSGSVPATAVVTPSPDSSAR